MIFPEEDRKLAKERKKADKRFEAKFINLKNDAEWGIIGDLFYIQYITGKNPRGFLIKDKTFADTFKQVFKQIWKEANR